MTSTMPGTSRTIMTTRRTPAPRVLLAARAHIDMHEKGLTSLAGAREIIATIRARKSVTKLILGHNSLGDDGCRELFRFLCTVDGRRHQIAEISLNANGIGDASLGAIAEYLEDNEHLRELFLQNNAFQGETEITVKFSTAINASKLELLSLASNQQLSDPFFIPFISNLDSSTLRELQLSALGLTRLSAPVLTVYCTSIRSRALETLKCNGNSLGARAVRSFLAALRTTNFTLQKLEVYANADFRRRDTDGGDEAEDAEESVEEARVKWQTCEQDMKNMLVRNELLRRKVHEEALSLLSYARILLLSSSRRSSSRSRPSSQTPPISSSSDQRSPRPSNSVEISVSGSLSRSESESLSHTSISPFPFPALPTELQQYILALLSPSLSVAQRVRIFSFTSDSATLRPLLPSLRQSSPHARCIPDPASLPFSSASSNGPTSPNLAHGIGMMGPPSLGSVPRTGMGLSPISDMGMGMGRGLMDFAPKPRASPCAGGKCMGSGGSVLCHRAEVRMRWLVEVGCMRFDADGRGEAEVLQLLARDSS